MSNRKLLFIDWDWSCYNADEIKKRILLMKNPARKFVIGDNLIIIYTSYYVNFNKLYILVYTYICIDEYIITIMSLKSV